MMMSGEELRKKVRGIDLALSSARRRQSPRTGFLHFYPQDESVNDVIAVYENFCFALVLIRQKTTESILEAKNLLERLLHFQKEGNFPLYLHDFPTIRDHFLPLKIAPVLIYLLREFSSVLGFVLKEKIEKALDLSLRQIEKLRLEKPLSPLWEMRYCACTSQKFSTIEWEPTQAEEWFEWIVTMQIANQSFCIPYSRKLQLLLVNNMVQEKGEPRPSPVEWLLAESDGYSPRLLRDHPQQIYTGLLWPIDLKTQEPSFKTSQIFWGGDKVLHSFALPKGEIISLTDTTDPGKGDLIEVEAFCDLAASVSISGKKGTVFQLGDWIEMEADGGKISLRFTLQEGEGEFIGHISRGNRPSQIACKGALQYETFDWRIALRTLRKATPCVIHTEVVCAGDAFSALRASEGLSIASPIACNPLST